MPRAVAIAVLAVAALGCKPVVDVANPSPFEEDDPRAGASIQEMKHSDLGETAPIPKAVEELAPGPATGTITRANLIASLDAGLGALLQHIEIDPKLDLRNRFVGWVVVKFPYTWVDIREGDLIMRINDQPIGKPGQVQKLWDSLRDAPSIVVRGERDEAPFVLKFDVVDDEPLTAGP